MSSCRTQRRDLRDRPPAGVRSQALVIILALIVVASGLVLAFLSLVQVDRQATASYSQSVRAEQIGQGSLQLIVGQLQQEMNKDNPPDTGGGLYPAIYTNVTSANIRPQPIGTNSAMPVLVKISAATNFYTGTNGGAAALFPNGSLMASSISSTVSVARWSQAYMGTFPNNASAPNWVMLSRSGPVTNTTMGVSVANSLNNPSPANTNYVVGRFAYAIYDEGSLLDITVAGHPSALTAAQSAQIKGSLAGADLTPLGINPDQLIAWRNATTGASTNTYINYVTNYASTNGFQAVYPGDSTFLSRQDLISAAQNGIAGLSTSVLTNLATFTREANSPSWSPSYNATDLGGNNGTGNVYAYKNNALTSGSTNRFIIGVRAGTANSAYQAYHDDGTTYADPISAGDSLVRRRFSLARLNWLGPNGAQNGGTTANIQACFGLKWATAVDSNLNTAGASLWQYVGPTGSTELGSIETLDQVAAETTKREPNFFELLQAGILSGSLAVDGGGTTANIIPNIHLKSATLQILRIGASIIDQYDADSDPTLIEYSQSGIPWIASGSENLPYLNTVETVGGVSPDNASALAVYLLFGFAFRAISPFILNMRLRRLRTPPTRMAVVTQATSSPYRIRFRWRLRAPHRMVRMVFWTRSFRSPPTPARLLPRRGPAMPAAQPAPGSSRLLWESIAKTMWAIGCQICNSIRPPPTRRNRPPLPRSIRFLPHRLGPPVPSPPFWNIYHPLGPGSPIPTRRESTIRRIHRSSRVRNKPWLYSPSDPQGDPIKSRRFLPWPAPQIRSDPHWEFFHSI
jgi:hypothetical protein